MSTGLLLLGSKHSTLVLADGGPPLQRWKLKEEQTLVRSVARFKFKFEDDQFWERFQMKVSASAHRDIVECERYYRHLMSTFRRPSLWQPNQILVRS